MINGPDGFTGVVMAIESIPGAMVLIHGPGGCRVRNSLLSMTLVPRDDRTWGEYGEPYFAGYSRVPASYIDGDDYIGGAVQRLENALEYVMRRGPKLIAVIDSPGASLMADDHMGAVRDAGMHGDVLVIGGPLMSSPVRRSYGMAIAQVLEHVSSEPLVHDPGTVCLIGVTVLDSCWEDVVTEFSSYLEDMGLEVLCVPGAGASVDDLRRSASAELAVCVCPESCDGLIEAYRSLGLKVFVPEESPVGFDATRRWISGVAEAAGRDAGPALEGLRRAESRFERRLGGMRYNLMRVAGMTFSASAPASVLSPLSAWLSGRFGMTPLAMIDEESSGGGRMEASDVMVCDGNTALRMECGRRCTVAISTGFAVIGSDGLLARPIFGALGAVHIADSVLRAARGRQA